MTAITIRAASSSDESRWRELFAAYNKFYRAKVAEDAVAETWRRILDPENGMGSLIAVTNGQIVGICNYLFHDSTWSVKPSCYLEDLFVDPACRGSGAARALILACEKEARTKGARRLYWHTQEYNAPARSLYDTVVPRSSFIVYVKSIE